MTLALKVTAVACFAVGVYYVFWEGEGAALMLIGVFLLFQLDPRSGLTEIRDTKVRVFVALVGVVLLVIGAFLLIDDMEEPAPELPPPPT